MGTQDVAPHELLLALDGLVRRDGGPSHLSGLIVVAVKGSDEASFWHAAFGEDRLLGCGYLAGIPPDADAVLLFTEEQATGAVAGTVPLEPVSTFGEQQLLDAFVDRYCSFRSMVDIRAGG